MKFYFLIISFCIATLGMAQINASELDIDYGVIERNTELEKEIFFVNTSLRNATLLTNDFPREYDAHVSSKKIAPGDTMFLRWKYNPILEGRFSDKITLWFSTMEKPLELNVKGDVKFIDPYASPACPSFNERPAGQEKSFSTYISVLEEGSRNPIKNAQVKVVDNGVVYGDFFTDKKGELEKKLPIRYFYFLATAEGYEPFHFYSYVNSKNHDFRFELVPIVKPEMETELELEEPVEEAISELVVPEEPKETVLVSEPKGDFSVSEFSPNNIVFLVDISGSMNSSGRLDILKSAMIEMVEMMRPEDKISLVSYARSASVLLEPTSGANKEFITTQIRALQAKGATSGQKGLKQAYKLAKSAFISKGNNRVYIATDGVFKVSEEEAINKMVKKFARKKIYLSVLGIKGTEYTKKKMSELADLGRGEFLALEDFDHSGEDLKNLVKFQSKR